MSDDNSVLILAFVILWCIFGLFGAYVAAQKNRAGMGGLILGFLFGPLGVLIEALLPTKEPREASPRTDNSRYARQSRAGARQRLEEMADAPLRDQLAAFEAMTGTERREYEREVRNAEKRRKREAWRAERGIE